MAGAGMTVCAIHHDVSMMHSSNLLRGEYANMTGEGDIPILDDSQGLMLLCKNSNSLSLRAS
ncbi:hypothetical protein OCU04_003595 [Sclerotinia nivalis]|uniref:Uncharacterized protein n=1 Tax=Sclerotinia nivalis TaxID=352851 RepID=A0A9X0AS89_9HELO|nr:hypothetical protein OCU04_003595 [Sclerotinia nivalis]